MKRRRGSSLKANNKTRGPPVGMSCNIVSPFRPVVRVPLPSACITWWTKPAAAQARKRTQSGSANERGSVEKWHSDSELQPGYAAGFVDEYDCTNVVRASPNEIKYNGKKCGVSARYSNKEKASATNGC